MIRLVDSNNYFRRVLEGDGSSSVLRNLIGEVERSDMVEIWVWDGSGALKRRRAVYPDYKSKRVPAADGFYELMDLFQMALLYTKAVQIKVPEYEGDDVIATLAREYMHEGVLIESNDKDFLQLLNADIRVNRDPMAAVAASDVRLYKTLVGDPSDCISGLPGFGEKAWTTCSRLDAFRDFFASRDRGRVPQDLEKVREHFDVKPKAAQFLMEHPDKLLIMWDIIGFYHVPSTLIAESTIPGVSDPGKADAALSEFLH